MGLVVLVSFLRGSASSRLKAPSASLVCARGTVRQHNVELRVERERERGTHVGVVVLDGLPLLGLLGAERVEQARARAPVPPSHHHGRRLSRTARCSTVALLLRELLLDLDLDGLCRLLLELRVAHVRLVVVVVLLRLALVAALDREEVVEVGEGRAQLERLVDRVEVERICEGGVSSSPLLAHEAGETRDAPFLTTPTR